MRSPEGKDYWSGGVFSEIVPGEKIVATDSFTDEKGNVVPASFYGMESDWPLEQRVEMTFEQIGTDKTKLTILYPDFGGVNAKDLDDMQQGWNQSFDKLEKILK